MINLFRPEVVKVTGFSTSTHICTGYKIRPSLTTSKDGLIAINIHFEETMFNSGFGWSI